METNGGNVAVLTHPEQLAGAADLKVAHRDRVACSQLRVLGDHLKPLLAVQRGRDLAVAEEVCVGASRTAPHPTPELIELGQAKRVGAVHDQRVGVWDIQARLDDRRAQQDIDLARIEEVHHIGQLRLGQLPVADTDASFRHRLLQVERIAPIV
jgi:hypothetical protein